MKKTLVRFGTLVLIVLTLIASTAVFADDENPGPKSAMPPVTNTIVDGE